MSAEDLIFSQLIKNEEYARKVIPHISVDYFSSDPEKNFWKIYSHFFKKYNKVPSKRALLLEVEKLKSSADVYNSMVDIINRQVEFEETLDYLVEQTERFCKEKAIYNALKEAILIVDGQSKTKGPDAIPSILQDALAVCFDTSVGHNYFDDYEARYDYYHKTEARIKTGLGMIDNITKGGFPRKTLNVLLAPPHGGKSLVLVNMGVGALLQGSNVLYISAEMAAEEIARRFDVNMLDIDFDTLEVLPRATYTSKFNKIAKASHGKLVVKEYPTGMGTAAHFRALLAELKTKQNFVPDMVIIDYMNICGSEYYKAGSNQNSYTVIGSVGKELRALAIENDFACITATQTNRSGVNNSEVDMTNVSDSASTSMIADWMLAIINTDDLKQMNQLLLKQIKNRYGGISENEKFLMGVDYLKMKLYDLEGAQLPKYPDKKKTSKIETANDTFIDMGHQIKTVSTAFDDFNF